MNVFAIVLTIGAGLAISTRTSCGMALGEKNYMLARKYALMGYVLAFFYSVAGGILICGLNGQIAGMFTEVAEVLPPLKWQIVLMGICTFFAGSGATGATMFRTINKSGYYYYCPWLIPLGFRCRWYRICLHCFLVEYFHFH